MDTVLLDTDVFSFLTRAYDTRAHLYQPHIQGKRISLSFISVGEIYFGMEDDGWGPARRAAVEQKLHAAIVVRYDLGLCKTYGRVKASLPRGVVVQQNDLWIACTAIHHSLPLVTHNRKHFAVIPGMQVITEAP
jgi:predicted nucleic acid-binding protein